MNEVQPVALHPVGDRPAAEPERDELVTADEPVLAIRQGRDRHVQATRL